MEPVYHVLWRVLRVRFVMEHRKPWGSTQHAQQCLQHRSQCHNEILPSRGQLHPAAAATQTQPLQAPIQLGLALRSPSHNGLGGISHQIECTLVALGPCPRLKRRMVMLGSPKRSIWVSSTWKMQTNPLSNARLPLAVDRINTAPAVGPAT